GPYTVNEGASISLSGVNSSGAVSNYDWDLNYDGSNFDTDATGVAPTFNASQIDGPSTRTIALRVSGPGGSDIDTGTVTINNVDPTVNAGTDATISAGGTFQSSGSFTDPGPNDGWTGTVDYGDGNGAVPLTLNTNNKTFALQHLYASAG